MTDAAANTPAAASTAAPREVRVAGEVNRMIQAEVAALYARLEPLRRQARFPSFASVNVPMVLVLGNHSSGKSTFINHMLGQDVQKTGRAPTDCTFTVLVGGAREERLDGSALVRHEALGFGDVQRLFGREFVSQVELKVVAKSALLDDGGLMVVDSPGMIDPPGKSLDRTDTDRGYDFKRVVQWFAERADVILVMFDPDKPGTTFETLDVLTSSLRGLSSKMLLILNKVDDFHTVHDFARAYGALCWNLSKVIQRKDLPFIYTMYVPQDKRQARAGAAASKKVTTVRTTRVNGEVTSREVVSEQDDAVSTSTTTTSAAEQGASLAFDVQKMLEHEFDGTRSEVMREVERAPDRATDNVLNLLKATASRLKMHVALVEACKKEYADLATFWKRVQIAGVVAGVGLVSFYLIRTVGNSAPAVVADAVADSSSSSKPTPASAPSSSPSPPLRGSSPSAGQEWQANWAKQVARSQSTFRYSTFFKLLLSSCASNLAIWKASVLNLEFKRTSVLQWLPATFARVYASFLCKSDRLADETSTQWQAVQPGLELALAATPLHQFPPFEPKDKSYLDDVLNLHIPRLDRSVRDRAGDDHAYLRFKHLKKPAAVSNTKGSTDE